MPEKADSTRVLAEKLMASGGAASVEDAMRQIESAQAAYGDALATEAALYAIIVNALRADANYDEKAAAIEAARRLRDDVTQVAATRDTYVEWYQNAKADVERMAEALIDIEQLADDPRPSDNMLWSWEVKPIVRRGLGEAQNDSAVPENGSRA